jgi:hypothetical protein
MLTSSIALIGDGRSLFIRPEVINTAKAESLIGSAEQSPGLA